MEEDSTIWTVGSTENFQKWMRQGDNGRVKMDWNSGAGSSAKINPRKPKDEKDTEMKEASKIAGGLKESKHAVKELLKE